MMTNLAVILTFHVLLYQSASAQSEACSKIDLALLVDGSASVYQKWFADDGGLKFTREFVNKFDVGPDNVRVSIQEFADSGYILYRFSDNQNKDIMTNEILPTLQIRHNYETRYEHAFQMCYDDQFAKGNGQRDYVDNIAVLITDGSYFPDKSYAVYEARRLSTAGIKLYIFGFGNIDRQFMLDMLNGDQTKLYLYPSHSDLTKSLEIVYRAICPSSSGFNFNINQIPAAAQPARAIPEEVVDIGSRASAATSGCNMLDLAILVDASASAYQEWFATNGVLQFTRRFVDKFNVGTDNVRVSIQEFADYGYLLYRFANLQDKATILNEILPSLQIRQRYETRYEHAFQMAYREQFTKASGARDFVDDIVVLLTDGSYYPDKSYAIYEARKLTAAGIKLFIFGWGDLDQQFLLDMVNGDQTKLRIFPTPQDVTSAVNSLYNSICPGVSFVNTLDRFSPGEPVFARDIPPGPAPQQTPSSSGCTTLDVCFLIDTTFRIMSNWDGPRGTREFLKSLMRKFTTGNPGVQTCAQLLTDSTSPLWYLRENPDKYSMDARIRDGMPYSATSILGYSNSLMKIMNEQFISMNGDRASSPNALVIVASDYVQDAPTEEVIRQATALQIRGIKTFVISWGRPNRILLQQLVGGNANAVVVNDDDMSPFGQIDMIYSSLCSMML